MWVVTDKDSAGNPVKASCVIGSFTVTLLKLSDNSFSADCPGLLHKSFDFTASSFDLACFTAVKEVFASFKVLNERFVTDYVKLMESFQLQFLKK